MILSIIGIASSVAAIVLKIADREKKYAVLSAVLGVIGAVAVLIAVIRNQYDEEAETMK